MAKNNVTRKDAIAAAIALFEPDAPEVAVLQKMLDSLNKPRKKSDAPSKSRIENLALLDDAVSKIAANGEPVTSKWLTEHVRGILTTQKAAAVMRLGVETGKINKLVDGRKVAYTVA